MRKIFCILFALALVIGGHVATSSLVLAWDGATTIRDETFYVASSQLRLGAWTTVWQGVQGYVIADPFQINLEYQPGILDKDIANLNTYLFPANPALPPGHVNGTWQKNFSDNDCYVLRVNVAGGLTVYEYQNLTETVVPDIQWTLTGWHQTILAGKIVDHGDGTISLLVVPSGTYRPFVNDPPVNQVEIFSGQVACEVWGYRFAGNASQIGVGSILVPILRGSAEAATQTGTGDASFTASPGAVGNLQAAQAPAGAPAVLRHGMFSFEITGIDTGQTVTITVELPSSMPVGTRWWKYQGGSWYSLPIGSDDGDNVITVTLTDGGLGEADGAANGVIVDPGGPGYLVAGPAYGLMVSSTEGGSVTTPGEGVFPHLPGDVVNLVATPDAGYKFVKWTGDVDSIADVNSPSTTITMEGWHSITANFEKEVVPPPPPPPAPPPVYPTVSTQFATDITGDSAYLNMSYTVGDIGRVEVRFAYRKSGESDWSYTGWVTKTASGTHAEKLTKLESLTKYDFRAQLRYDSAVIEGKILEFATVMPSGCFIATAAYGTPTAQEIDVLREFRDGVLLKSSAGSQFVALYYRLSPPVAGFIARHEAVRTLVRELLIDPIVWVVDLTGNMWRN